MNGKFASLMTLVAILASISFVASKVQKVEASGTIYIRADGSIDPPTAPISTTDEVTYTFTGNIYDSIVVEKDNIVVDGAGYTVQKTESDQGITLQERINVTIQNALTKGFSIGIGLYSSDRCTLYGNRLEGDSSGPGIAMHDSEYNKLLNNTLLNNDHSIQLGQSSNNVIDGNNASYNHQGISVESFSHNNTVTHNTASNNSGDGIYVNEGSSNNVIANNTFSYNGWGAVITRNSSGNVLRSNTLVGNEKGVTLNFYAPDNLIVGNTISSNLQRGISIEESPGNRIIGNNITSSGVGIVISGSEQSEIEHNEILDNTLSGNDHGITLGFASNNLVDGNNASYNFQGISMGGPCNNNTIAHNVANYNNGGILLSMDSSNNLVTDNEFSYNRQTGIVIAPNSSRNFVKGNTIIGNDKGISSYGNSSNNIVYDNNFVNNTEQTTNVEQPNVWDNGAEGNYWSDYKGVDLNGDGIGDTLLPHLGIDDFPLVELWSETRIFNAYTWKGVNYQVTTQSNNTVASFSFSLSTKQISFNVTGPTGNVGYCNITIPKTLLQGNPYQASIDEKAASSVSVTETADETSLYFVYDLTTHGVKVTGTQVLDVIPPLADAGPNQTVNEDTMMTFDGSGSHDNVDIVNYTWTFVDVTSKTLTGMKPTYIFNTPGKYTVTLNVTDAMENWNVSSVLVTVLDITLPVADTGQNQTVLQGATVAFDANKSSDNVGIVSYSWNFGDETSQTGIAATHAYANPGAYVVTLTVKDAAGNAGTAKITINVRARGLIALTPSTGFASTTVAGSRFSNNSRITISWDGTTIPAVPNTVTTDANGSFTALISVPTQTIPGVHTVNATDETGNWNTATFTVPDMAGPQGPKGDTGQQGSQGPEGPQGPSVNIQDLLILVALPTTLAVLAICLATVALLRKRDRS